MRLLRRMFGMMRRVFHSLSLWSTVQIRNVTAFLQRSVTVRRKVTVQSRSIKQIELPRTLVPRSLLPASFPETPMPATPLIRVLETIDLSSSSVEHFLDGEQEHETSGEVPVVHEYQQSAEQSLQE